jgi:hypothetical protein
MNSMARDCLACLVFVLLMLTGCPICEDCLADGSSGTDTSGDGSSGTDTSGDGDGEPAVCGVAPEPVLELSFSAIKQFDFSWAAVPGAEFYQLLESPALGEPFVQIGEDIVGESISITMPLYLRVNASYMLRAYNGDGCVDSAIVDVASSLTEAVGYFKASNTGWYNYFGWSLTLSGDGSTLAIGNHPHQFDEPIGGGAVYVFARVGAVWGQQAYVEAPNPEAYDYFGSSVSLSSDGNTLAVGAHQGAVYVFIRNGDVWSQQGYVTASNPGDVALSGDGNTLAVGATGTEAVYVFARNDGVWSQQALAKASNTGTADQFGHSVALSGNGDTLAVGAYGEDSSATGVGGNQDDNSMDGAGAVYVFARNDGVWSQQTYVKASNTDTLDQFGRSVALSGNGDTLAVGADGENSSATGIDGNQDDTSLHFAGAVYVFARNNGVWSQQAYVKASNTDEHDHFGHSVALSGDGNTLAVGAASEDSNATGIDGDQADDSASGSGAASVFGREGANWLQQAYVKASSTNEGTHFGYEVGVANDGNTLAVGAIMESSGATGIGGNQDDHSLTFSGAVYLY